MSLAKSDLVELIKASCDYVELNCKECVSQLSLAERKVELEVIRTRIWKIRNYYFGDLDLPLMDAGVDNEVHSTFRDDEESPISNHFFSSNLQDMPN